MQGTQVPWRAVFGDDRPVEVEIGPGRGDVLLALAAAHPEHNFFGIDRRGGAADTIVATACARGLTNVRVIGADARCVVARLVPPASVAAYHVYFPDPWPKTGHRHRRLVSDAFARALATTLVPGGAVHVASDLSTVVDDVAARLAAAALVHVTDASPPAARPVSAFERKYARERTYYARFVRPR